ncbi:MAG: helix-turn-helix transcriptional regulator [Lachnospiraceae bacterium]|nr:helix-turn-helix transcriptional regulator [Lachnospiraceae bacterium]
MNRLKEIREERNISQVKLAEMSGITRQTIAKIESDPQASVKVATLQKLADALGVRFYDIFLP